MSNRNGVSVILRLDSDVLTAQRPGLCGRSTHEYQIHGAIVALMYPPSWVNRSND